MRKHVFYAAAALAASAALVLSGCSGGGGGDGKSPIVVGSVNTKSGAATFPEASLAAAAVIADQNAKGGINGHKIDYKALDDKGDPATASANARELVGSDEAVAMVGSASLIECEINATYYEQQKILSVPGIGGRQSTRSTSTAWPATASANMSAPTVTTRGSLMPVLLRSAGSRGAGRAASPHRAVPARNARPRAGRALRLLTRSP